MHRTTKRQAHAEMGIPPAHEHTVYLTLSPIEVEAMERTRTHVRSAIPNWLRQTLEVHFPHFLSHSLLVTGECELASTRRARPLRHEALARLHVADTKS